MSVGAGIDDSVSIGVMDGSGACLCDGKGVNTLRGYASGSE